MRRRAVRSTAARADIGGGARLGRRSCPQTRRGDVSTTVRTPRRIVGRPRVRIYARVVSKFSSKLTAFPHAVHSDRRVSHTHSTELSTACGKNRRTCVRHSLPARSDPEHRRSRTSRCTPWGCSSPTACGARCRRLAEPCGIHTPARPGRARGPAPTQPRSSSIPVRGRIGHSGRKNPAPSGENRPKPHQPRHPRVPGRSASVLGRLRERARHHGVCPRVALALRSQFGDALAAGVPADDDADDGDDRGHQRRR